MRVQVDLAKPTWKNPCPPRIRTSSTCLYRQRTPGRPAVPWRQRLSETLRTRQSHILPFVLFHLFKKKTMKKKRKELMAVTGVAYLFLQRPRSPRSSQTLWGRRPAPWPGSRLSYVTDASSLCWEAVLQNIMTHVQGSSWFRSFNILFSFLCSFQDVW